jgi:predicted ATPase
LPVAVQPLIGRKDLVLELREALRGARLLTLLGPGGVGKTSLAYELARISQHDFRDGVFAVELVSVREEGAMGGALATALHIQVRHGESLADTVVDMLRPRQALLLIDNCEHLATLLGPLVDRVLRAAPGVTVLATSREPLAVQSEQRWPIEPLPVAAVPAEDGSQDGSVEHRASAVEALRQVPAIALFVERACASDPEFLFDEATAEPVAEICRRLDGMPLAIELAAARVRAAGVSEIASRLDQRFRLLKGGRRGGDPRHQTLLDAVRWSCDLLAPDEQRLFRELSVFAGQFTLRDAAEVCGQRDELDALDLIAALSERSMLSVRTVHSRGRRYELLETLGAYGRAQLTDDERKGLSHTHAQHFAQVARDLAQAQGGSDEGQASHQTEQAFSDLRAAQAFALQEGDLDTALELICSAREYGMRAMRYEVLNWAQAAGEAAGVEEHELAPTLTGMRGYRAWLRGEFDTALRLAAAAEAEEARRDARPSGLAQRVQANVLFAQGDVERGMSSIDRQYEIADAQGNKSQIVHAAYMGSVANSSRGDYEQAEMFAARALSLGLETRSPTDLASGWVAKGFAAHADLEEALHAFSESERFATLAGNRWMSTFARTEASGVLLRKGELQAACEGLAQAVDIWHRAGEWSQQWLTLGRCVVALSDIDELELAAMAIGAVEQRTALGTPPFVEYLRDRATAAAGLLSERLGAAHFEELRAAGAALPVVDVIHRTRSALLGI